jgi:hypothetical protein
MLIPHEQHHQASWGPKLIMKVSLAPDAMKPDFQGVTTRWNRGFMAFRQVWRTRIVMLMVPV